MTREDLKDKIYSILWDKFTPNRRGKWEIDNAVDEIAELFPLPPAEGAEKSCPNCRFYNSPTYHDKMWCRDCQQLNHYEQSQPTAEGAEEILAKYKFSDEEGASVIFMADAIIAMKEFATLHAQRIAEKMVSERCKKCKYRGLPDSIQEALNSGDGVYRP